MQAAYPPDGLCILATGFCNILYDRFIVAAADISPPFIFSNLLPVCMSVTTHVCGSTGLFP